MMTALLTVGQRVETPLGPGTIRGFEIFTDNGRLSSVTDEDHGFTRVQVQLDTPGNWLSASLLQRDPFMYRSQLSALNET